MRCLLALVCCLSLSAGDVAALRRLYEKNLIFQLRDALQQPGWNDSETFFYRATVEDGEEAVQQILVSGGGSKLKGLIEFLSTRFEIPVEVFDPFRKIRVDSRGFDPDYMREIVPEMAIAVGLALRGVDVQ